MPFLVEIWNDNIRTGDPDFRVADGFHSLTNQWNEGLEDIQGLNWAIDTPHGGMIRSKFGLISFLPTVIADDYIGVDISYSNTDESGAVLLFSGVAYINARERTKFVYDLFTDMPNELIPDAGLNLLSTDVLQIFIDYFEDVSVGWTVNDDEYSAVDKSVDIASAGGGQLYSEFLSDLCQTYGCYFVLDGATSTVYLREIAAGVNKVVTNLDGFDFFPSRYTYSIPPSRVTVNASTPVHSYNSPYSFSRDLSLTAFSNDAVIAVNQNLADNARDLYKDHPLIVEFFMPLEFFVDREFSYFDMNKFQWADDTVIFAGGEKVFEMIIHNISFNVQKVEAILSGYVTIYTDAPLEMLTDLEMLPGLEMT